MKKTPVLFLVDHEAEQLLTTVRPGCEWVLAGEGVATIKMDGSACLWRGGRLWKRFDRKLNKPAQRQLDEGGDLGPVTEALFKVPPTGFEPCERNRIQSRFIGRAGCPCPTRIRRTSGIERP